MGDLLAVDPGLNAPGAALFRDGVLVAAADIPIPKIDVPSLGHRALMVAQIIVFWVDQTVGARVSTVAHEWPQIYTASKSRANPNNLIGMAAIDGAVNAILAIIAASRGEQLEIRTYQPAEWSGQLTKDTHKGAYWKSARGARIWSRLSEAERSIAAGVDHDAGDAIGIGLHSLSRLGARRAFATGR